LGAKNHFALGRLQSVSHTWLECSQAEMLRLKPDTLKLSAVFWSIAVDSAASR
jgi:hypothetical protein